MIRLVAALVVLLAVGIAHAPGASSSSALRPDCEPANARVLLANTKVTVYGHGRDSGDRQDLLAACAADGVDLSLGDPTGTYYRPPVMALSGDTVAA